MKKKSELKTELRNDEEIAEIAKELFDNRLGWSNGRNPYAPRETWVKLGTALYGKDDRRVKELKEVVQ